MTMLASPSQGLKLTLPVALAPVPLGLPALVGPLVLPHQSRVAFNGPPVWLFCTPVVLLAKLSFVAVTVQVSLAPEPTRMPVVSLVSVLSVIVALALFSTETPTR